MLLVFRLDGMEVSISPERIKGIIKRTKVGRWLGLIATVAGVSTPAPLTAASLLASSSAIWGRLIVPRPRTEFMETDREGGIYFSMRFQQVAAFLDKNW